MIKRIWNDPVWSKVISAGVIGIISLSYVKFISITDEITYTEAINKLFETKVKVVYVIAFFGIYLFITKFLKREKPYYSKEEEALRSNNTMLDKTAGVKCKWTVYFNNDTPFISDLTVFCTKHGETPMRFIGNRCPIQNCDNFRNEINEYSLKNFIESDLIAKWEKIKK